MLRRVDTRWSGVSLIGAGAAQISFWLSAVLVILIVTGRVITFFNWIIPIWRSAQIVNVVATLLALIGLIGVYAFIRERPSMLSLLSFLLAFSGTILLLTQRTILLLNTRSPFFLSPFQKTFFTSPLGEAIAAILILGYLLIGASIWPFGKLFRISGVLLVAGLIFEKVLTDAPPLGLMEAVLSDISVLDLQFATTIFGGLIWGIGALLLGQQLLRDLQN